MEGPGFLHLGQIKAIASSVLDQMDRLGLLWRLRPATVSAVDASGAVRAKIDGDDEPIRVVSMVGAVGVGARVMVLTTPPAGNHIVGWANPPSRLGRGAAQLWGQTGRTLMSFAAQASATLDVSFGRTYAVSPQVDTRIYSGAGATAGWHTRAISVTQTGFTIFAFGPSSTWESIAVDWTVFVPS
jgi:hypothetical protein